MARFALPHSLGPRADFDVVDPQRMMRTYDPAEGFLPNHSYAHGTCGSISTQNAVERGFVRYTERERAFRWSVGLRATLQAPQTLFGQSQKVNSAKYEVASSPGPVPTP